MIDTNKREMSQDRMTLALDIFIDYLLGNYQEESQFSLSSRALSNSNNRPSSYKNGQQFPFTPLS